MNTAKQVKVFSASAHYLIVGMSLSWKKLIVSCMDGVDGIPLEKVIPGAGDRRVVVREEGELEHVDNRHGRAVNVLGKVQTRDLQ